MTQTEHHDAIHAAESSESTFVQPNTSTEADAIERAIAATTPASVARDALEAMERTWKRWTGEAAGAPDFHRALYISIVRGRETGAAQEVVLSMFTNEHFADAGLRATIQKLIVCCAYAHQTIEAYARNDVQKAWQYAANCQYWHGLTVGVAGTLSADFATAVEGLRTEIPRAGAAATNARAAEHRAAVHAWLDKHYDEQQALGARHTDMAAALEKLVLREHETILKDITAWKKKRKR